jgi:hypothetical protein
MLPQRVIVVEWMSLPFPGFFVVSIIYVDIQMCATLPLQLKQIQVIILQLCDIILGRNWFSLCDRLCLAKSGSLYQVSVRFGKFLFLLSSYHHCLYRIRFFIKFKDSL